MSTTSTTSVVIRPAVKTGDVHTIEYAQRKDYVAARCDATRTQYWGERTLPFHGRVITDDGNYFAIRWQERGTYVYQRDGGATANNPWRDRGILVLVLP